MVLMLNAFSDLYIMLRRNSPAPIYNDELKIACVEHGIVNIMLQTITYNYESFNPQNFLCTLAIARKFGGGKFGKLTL